MGVIIRLLRWFDKRQLKTTDQLGFFLSLFFFFGGSCEKTTVKRRERMSRIATLILLKMIKTSEMEKKMEQKEEISIENE